MSSVKLQRTNDLGLVRSILINPRIYPALADDNAPSPADFYPNPAPAIHYMIAHDQTGVLGVCTTHPINSVTWEAHIAVLPRAWGKTHDIAGAFFSWLFSETECRTAVGFVPASNRLCLRFARLHFTECGYIPNAYLKGGTLHALHVFQRQNPHFML